MNENEKRLAELLADKYEDETIDMTTGRPDEVDAACKRLIENVGRGGGFILECAFGIPDETPVENVRAMFQSVQKYSA